MKTSNASNTPIEISEDTRHLILHGLMLNYIRERKERREQRKRPRKRKRKDNC